MLVNTVNVLEVLVNNVEQNIDSNTDGMKNQNGKKIIKEYAFIHIRRNLNTQKRQWENSRFGCSEDLILWPKLQGRGIYIFCQYNQGNKKKRILFKRKICNASKVLLPCMKVIVNWLTILTITLIFVESKYLVPAKTDNISSTLYVT